MESSGPSRGSDAPGPSRDPPPWLQGLQDGNFQLSDLMLISAEWTRPLGRWARLLLLLAGELFGVRVSAHVGLTLEYVLSTAELANLALRAYGLVLFREGRPRYLWFTALLLSSKSDLSTSGPSLALGR